MHIDKRIVSGHIPSQVTSRLAIVWRASSWLDLKQEVARGVGSDPTLARGGVAVAEATGGRSGWLPGDDMICHL